MIDRRSRSGERPPATWNPVDLAVAAASREQRAEPGRFGRRPMLQSLQTFLDGLRRFQELTVSRDRAFYEHLSQGQQPLAMFITCTDSRVDPHLMLQTKPGQLFVMRNAGNIVRPYDLPGTSEAAALEFAIHALDIKHVIVCGHSHCGVMHRLMAEPPPADMPAVAAWLRHAETVRRVVHARLGPGNSPRHVCDAIRENVVQQLQHLQTHPAVAEKLVSREIMLHGWIYYIGTGDVLAYDHASKSFVPLLGEVNPDI